MVRLVGGERSQWLLALDVPYNVLESFVIDSVESRSDRPDIVILDVGTGDVGPGNDVVFARRELEESNIWVSESEEINSVLAVEIWSTPECHTCSMGGSQVGTERRPAEVKLSPFGVLEGLVSSASGYLDISVSAIPVDSCCSIGKSKELITTKTVTEPRS